MAFQLRNGESLRKGLKRMARKQIDSALEELGGRPGGESVHEARKCFKKIRALLRLVRPRIKQRVYHTENYRFRDAGQALSAIRDAKILIESLDKLTEHFADHIAGRSFGEVRAELRNNLRNARQRLLENRETLKQVAVAVELGRDRVKDWTDVPKRWSSVAAGLQDAYQRVRRAFARAQAGRTLPELHEWRKQVKYLRHQLMVLQLLQPDIMEDLAKQAERLGDLLGDDHDLAVLRQVLEAYRERLSDPGAVETLHALIDRRRAELQDEAIALGESWLRGRPKDFANRIKGYWRCWQKHATSGRSQASAT
jgi:CHAD domain-containing protein